MILVGTHMEDVTDAIITRLVDRLDATCSKYAANMAGFVPVSCAPSHTRNIDTLYHTVLEAARAQSHMGELKPMSYTLLEKQVLEHCKPGQMPVVSMAEFESMVLRCGINSSGQTVAEWLTDLGTVVFFNDKKLGFSQRVILDPSWLVRLISTIITTKENCVHDGILYHRDLHRIWRAPDFPTKHHEALLELLNKMEIAYTFQDESSSPAASTSMSTSTSTTTSAAATTTTIDANDASSASPPSTPSATSPHSWIPSMLSSRRPPIDGTWISVDDYLRLSGSKQVERVYLFDFLPLGFFSRLIVRLLHFTKPLYYWRSGILLTRGDESGLVEFEPHSMELSVKVRGKGASRLLRVIVDSIDLLIKGWYTISATVSVPFNLKGEQYQSMTVDPRFGLEELEHAAAFGHTHINFKDIPVAIDSIAPDLVLADLNEYKIDHKDLKIGKCVGEGGFGMVYFGEYKGNKVAIKEIKVDDAMKVEAYREFRHEVALVWYVSLTLTRNLSLGISHSHTHSRNRACVVSSIILSSSNSTACASTLGVS